MISFESTIPEAFAGAAHDNYKLNALYSLTPDEVHDRVDEYIQINKHYRVTIEAMPVEQPKVAWVLKNINWAMLRQQKQMLLALTKERNNDTLAEGLINFLDYLMDAVVADGLATNIEVFGKDI